MATDLELVERIYEAAALPERWPAVLGDIGRACGSAGGLFFCQSAAGLHWMAAPGVAWIIEEYIAGGWMPENSRGAPMIAEWPAGFRTDSDYRTATERAAISVYRDFLIPRGIDAAAGSMFQGARDDAIVLTFEHFGSHEEAKAAVPFLDKLRPHLGRALSLAAQMSQKHAANAVLTLQLAGVGAAIVSGDGRLRALNDGFADRLGGHLIERASGLRFSHQFLQARFAEAFASVTTDAGVRSIAVAARDDQSPLVIHLLPLRRGARDVFGWDGVLMLLAEPANASVPGADLLRLLFDLTPAEARLARHLLHGDTLADAASAMKIAGTTARVHLARIFAKTGVQRQPDLMRLLLGLGAPT